MEVKYTPALQVLNEARLGIISADWLKVRKLNINSYLAQSIKVFEDFKLMAELRQEIDNLKSKVTLTPALVKITTT